MKSIKDIQEEIISEFEMLEDWEEKYQHIIDLGKSLEPMDEKFKIEEWKVHGCQSNVWLYPEIVKRRLHFKADSDALITKGLLALILRPVQNQDPKEVAKYGFEFIEKLGLKEHLSPTRANGLNAVINKIKSYACQTR